MSFKWQERVAPLYSQPACLTNYPWKQADIFSLESPQFSSFDLHHSIYALSPSKLFLDTCSLLCVSYQVPFVFALISWLDPLPRNHHLFHLTISIRFSSFEIDFPATVPRISFTLRIAYFRSQSTHIQHHRLFLITRKFRRIYIIRRYHPSG